MERRSNTIPYNSDNVLVQFHLKWNMEPFGLCHIESIVLEKIVFLLPTSPVYHSNSHQNYPLAINGIEKGEYHAF